MFPPRHTQNTKPPSNTLKGDSPPPHHFARHGAHTLNHRASTATPAGLARGSAPSSFLQGHPPSLRFGHPDVTTEAAETSTHPPNRCSYVFRKRPQGVTRTLSARHTQNTKPSSNTLNRDSPPRPSSLGTGRTPKPQRTFTRTGGISQTPEPQMRRGIDIPRRDIRVSEAKRGRVPCRSKGKYLYLKPKSIKFRERKNPADSEESAGFSLMCAPWDSNPEPID